MSVLLLVALAGAALIAAYFTYGRWLSRRVFQLDPDARTPAHTERDDNDYVPSRRSIVFGHHFTSIAGTGPIVGPAIAVMWGWLPALLWVVVGSIFIGAVHDLGSIVVSLRRKGRSIGDIAGDLLGPRARLIFLGILIVGLWIVLAVFGLVIVGVLKQYPAAIFPVMFQIPIAIAMGLFVHRAGRSIAIPSVIALALMYASVVFGDASFGPTIGGLHAFNQWAAAQPIWAWVAFLLVYCAVASVLPVWLLLQPRDYINALQLISSLGLITLGLVAAALIYRGADASSPQSPDPSPQTLAFVAPLIDWSPPGAPPLLPVLFITVACGACSGFHCLVGSGTTSKQLSKETDARAVGYGSMLTEGFLATLVIAACAAGIGLGVTRGWDPAAGPPNSLFVAAEFSGQCGREYVAFHSPMLSTASVQLQLRVHQAESDFNQSGLVPDGATGWISLDGGAVRLLDSLEGVDLVGALAYTTQYSSWSAAGSLSRTVSAFVEGSANFLGALGIPRPVGVALIAVMVASFAATTMDSACRLQRYVIQELSSTFLPRANSARCRSCGYDLSGAPELSTPLAESGTDSITCPECAREEPAHEIYHHDRDASWRRASALNPFKWLATPLGATIAAVVSAAMLAAIPPSGQPWSLANAGRGAMVLWPLFGATNQLLAGFAFVVILAWLRLTKRPLWFAVAPAAIMLIVPASALAWQAFIGNADNPSWLASGNWLLVSIASASLALEAWLVIEALARMVRGRSELMSSDHIPVKPE